MGKKSGARGFKFDEQKVGGLVLRLPFGEDCDLWRSIIFRWWNVCDIKCGSLEEKNIIKR